VSPCRVAGPDDWCRARGCLGVPHDSDLTPVRDGTGPSRLLDMVEGRSKQVFKTWLEAQTPAFRDGIEIVAMDGFTGSPAACSTPAAADPD
jgi:hypothetical protein